MSFFSYRVYWVMQISWWLFTTLVLRQPLTKYFENPMHLGSYLSVNFIVGILFTHFYSKIYLKRERENGQMIVFPLVATLLLGLCFFLIDYFFGFQRYRKPSLGIELEAYDYYQFYLESIRYVIIWFLFFHLFLSNRNAQRKELQLANAEMSLKTAELENLKNQLNPHFLFNAINSIKALTIFDPELARQALTELSQLLRTSLTMGNQQLVSLEMELMLVRDYLFLEKIRYEKRLEYSFDIKPETLSLSVPPMSVQLLVENAIKHGIGKNKLGGKLMIVSDYKQNIFTLKVINTGKLINKTSDEGVGMKNLQKRLLLNFQDKASFTLTEENDAVVAQIMIKIEPVPVGGNFASLKSKLTSER
ncbi:MULTISPECIES: histidine kinase [unclassified Arcicella]|uniref:sensor histidine kinase n=1 Tax=unclassified Arcicella TaxID=2644986 RepID=UPI0028649E5D|nr:MULTISPECIES: histidine kinase [unclassified Arcicella]MDR6564004.1 sensor histidine kinase YesM [Arcicella sp. BE51]MDR6813757.1 sensor histidine kinase YesM [Arcicella sp. BE140]MDR6825069.1 sensor histidine kinase YesM [Arcicella sp. BE139]